MPDSLAVDMPAVRAEGLLRRLERGFLYLDRLLGRGLPQLLNPFMQTGAVAITTLIVATITGIVLRLFYSPSVHHAHESVAAMSAAPYTTSGIRACKTGAPTTCNFDYSGVLAETVLLGNVSYRAGERLQWDAAKLTAPNCPAADRFIRREYRQGWTL